MLIESSCFLRKVMVKNWAVILILPGTIVDSFFSW
ncbi:unnamed protein product [Brassica rapa subsp. trilocularis]